MIQFKTPYRLLTAALWAGACALPVQAQQATADDMMVLASQHSILGATMPDEVKVNAGVLDIVAPMWYGAADDGSIHPLPQLKESVDPYLESARKQGVKVMPIIRNFSPQPLLSDPAAIDRCVEALNQLTIDKQLDGLVIDFEHLKAASREPLVQLLGKLHAKLKPRNVTLCVAVPPHIWEKELDFKGVSDNSDLLYVMFYDYTGSWKKLNGPTAPLSWPENTRDIKRDLETILAEGVPPEKILLGLASYGLDFRLDPESKASDTQTLYLDELRDRLKSANADIQWDETKKAPFADYTDEQGRPHRVWIENAASYEAKLDLVREKQLRGVAIWAVRYPDRISSTDLWEVLRKAKAGR